MICTVPKLEGRLSRDIENYVKTRLCKLRVIFRTRDLRGVFSSQTRGFPPEVVGRVHCCSAFVALVPFPRRNVSVDVVSGFLRPSPAAPLPCG